MNTTETTPSSGIGLHDEVATISMSPGYDAKDRTLEQTVTAEDSTMDACPKSSGQTSAPSPVSHQPNPAGGHDGLHRSATKPRKSNGRQRALDVHGTPLRRGQRSQDRNRALNRQRDDLLKPEVRSAPVGTRIEPSLKARWDAAAESAGISGSAQLNLAIEDYLGVHEERHRHQDVVQELRDIERRLLDTARVLLEAHEAQRTRMAQLETMVGRLGQILESQESRFVNIEDLRGLLFGDEPSSDDDGESVVPSHDFGAPHLRAETECAEIRREHQ